MIDYTTIMILIYPLIGDIQQHHSWYRDIVGICHKLHFCVGNIRACCALWKLTYVQRA